MTKRNEEKPDKLKKVFDSLFGDIEEMDGLEARHLLQLSGIDHESVRRKMYEKLAQSAVSFRLKGKPVPAELQQALDSFRPLDAPPRNEEEAKRQAHNVIDRFLGQRAESRAILRFAFSYRNRNELTVADVNLLDSIVNKLKKQVEGKG